MLIPMSDRDINRFKVLQDVRERRLRQGDEFAIIMPRCGEKDANFTYVPRLWKQLHSIRNDISLKYRYVSNWSK